MIYFGIVEGAPPDPENYYEYNNKLYYYRIEMQSDQILLQDSCGRNFPIEYDFIKALGTAVFIVNETLSAADAADALYEKRMNELHTIVDHMNDNS